MPIRKTEAIVLRSRNWSKTSKIVTFYTSLSGKVQGLAKGAMRPKNKFGSSLESFSVSTLIFYEKEGRNLQIISDCTLRESFQEIREDLTKMAYASYFVELVDKGVKGKEEARGLFKLLFDFLNLLQAGKDAKLVAHAFEIHLLRILGYRPHLSKCVSCRSALEENNLKFSPLRGGALCGGCGGKNKDAFSVSPGILPLLQQIERMECEKLGRLKISDNLEKELEKLLTKYITFIYEEELNSAKFLKQLAASLEITTPA